MAGPDTLFKDTSGDRAELRVLYDMQRQGFETILLLRNSSGNGIDLVGLRLLTGPKVLRFIEVKYNTARESAQQKQGGNSFVRDRLQVAVSATMLSNYSGDKDHSYALYPPTGGGRDWKIEKITLGEGAELLLPYFELGGEHLTQTEIDRLLEELEKDPNYAPPPLKRPTDFVVEFHLVRVTGKGEINSKSWTLKPPR
ncbi:hypothetical protein DKT77_05085 [Meridianimarinicoccus roseus]|uniref:Uncharacterized protein n=1 Tax=Meridianimarinicoccus roseus TaxID=2072018 RepID=A0A2V2LDT3_9RHOB|nr:hypothetical protein [Meridianimarinicoccus roseus]PWR03710.1 hypothetical protein DKT77_05085 [Meridianimarinicoccus roseus]